MMCDQLVMAQMTLLLFMSRGFKPSATEVASPTAAQELVSGLLKSPHPLWYVFKRPFNVCGAIPFHMSSTTEVYF